MTDERRRRLQQAASDALALTVEGLKLTDQDTPWGDEEAKSKAALAMLALEGFMRVLDAPVLAVEREVTAGSSTIPASVEAA